MLVNHSLTQDEIAREQATFLSKVYAWMSLALVITAGCAMFAATNETLQQLIFGNRIMFYVLIFGELGLVWWLSSSIHKLSATTAITGFIAYSAFNGLTLSFVFMIYTHASIASTFLITAGTFAIMSAFGFYTKRDLTKLGSLLGMALIGLIISGIVAMFWDNEQFSFIRASIGVLVFVGLIAYDTQKIKEMNIIGNEGTDEDKKEAIMGALSLYLDFINLFLYLLRLLGSRRN